MLPQVIVLNGCSSAGKTTLARALQQVLPEQYLNFSIDSVLYALPPIDLALMQRGEPIQRRGYDWQALVRGYHYAIPSLLQAGLKLIIDNAWCEAGEIRELLTELAGYSVVLVGVQCDAETAAAREARRGDRAPGLSVWELPRVHQHFCYDIEVDSRDAVDTLVAQLMVKLQSGQDWRGAHETLVRLEMAG